VIIYKIKNWKRFQHFKDRRPIWIKLYRDILDDMEWHELDPPAAKMLVMLWLIASEDEGRLPSIKELAFRVRSTEKQIESTISKLSHWLEQDDIALISSGYQDDPLEKRREEKEKEKKVAVAFVVPPSIRPEVWKAFEEHRKKKRSPMTDEARVLIFRECGKIGGDPNDLLEQSIMRGWTGVFPIKGNGSSPPDPPKKKIKEPIGNCYCGTQGATIIGGEWMCVECINKG
jgi:hypothetical protein